MTAFDEIKDQDGYREINGNMVHEKAVVQWKHIKIGKGNVIGPYACIGTSAQYSSRTQPSDGLVEIGDNNIFREFVTVNRPTSFSKLTYIGSNGYFMIQSHIAHDCFIEDDVVLCNNVALAGHTYVMIGANLGLGVSVHQHQVIGSYTMIGMNSVVGSKADILPGNIYAGNNSRYIKPNTVGLQRKNVSEEMIQTEIIRYKKLRN